MFTLCIGPHFQKIEYVNLDIHIYCQVITYEPYFSYFIVIFMLVSILVIFFTYRELFNKTKLIRFCIRMVTSIVMNKTFYHTTLPCKLGLAVSNVLQISAALHEGIYLSEDASSIW